ncbi:hypothetical protein V6C32_14740 [Desulforamulus ruminis]|uniref:hypothetical protein n=1 Tax=Desulforamulus ruminis TaxID=1564 RepID=UPI002FDA70ED
MTGTQIKSLAETHLDGDIITDSDAITWINECQIEDLGLDARVSNSVNITVTDTTIWQNLPNQFLAVDEVRDINDSEYEGGYVLRNGKIRFDQKGTFTVWYWELPIELTALTETPQAHILLHRPIALFLASRFKSQDDDENQDAFRLMSEYEQKKSHALYQIDNPLQDAYPVIRMVF